MNKDTAVILPNPALYDDCAIVSCLKNIFSGTAKSRSNHNFAVSRKIADVKNELGVLNRAGTLEMSYAYLAAMERSIPGASFRYIVIYRNSKPVLISYFQLYALTSQNFNLEKNRGFVKHIFRFFLDLKKVSVLISGNALRNDTPFYCYNEDVLSETEVIEIITSAAENIADEENISAIVLKDLPQAQKTAKWLAAMGYNAPWEDKVMAMDIDPAWQTIDDYIAALTRKYKTRANKILAASAGIVARELSERDLQQYEREVYSLFKNVTGNQPFLLNSLAQDHFTLLKKVYKNDFEVFGFFRDQKLVAFHTAFVTSDDYELYYAGFDYSLNSEYQLYFNILFSGLKRAISLGKKHVNYGRTSFDAKASIGAKPVEMKYFIKTGNIPNVVSKWFANYFSTMEDGKWKLRNPLK